MKGLTRLALIAVAAVGMGLVASAPSYAIHKGAGGLVCGGCHTMHNSQGRTSLDGLTTSGNDFTAGGGSLILLRASVSTRAEIHNLCLQCHSQNGSRATDIHAPHSQTAPKVLTGASVAWDDSQSFNQIGAGGDFADTCTGSSTSWSCVDNGAGLGKGHSLGATVVTPPGSTGTAGLDYLTCTNCHDPHGVNIAYSGFSSVANKYRMLRMYPTGSGPTGGVSVEGSPATIDNTSSYIGGITGEFGTGNYTPEVVGGVAEWPIFKGTLLGTGVAADAAKSNHYSSDIANWCAACHDNWHETKVGSGANQSGNDWKRHPVNNLLTDGTPNSGASVPIINTAQYDTSLKAAGFGVPVARAAADIATDPVYYNMDNSKDRVFCLSCHFPHGSKYNDLLRWNYTDLTVAITPGNQKGNVVPSDDDPSTADNARGCQLCHNRGGF